MPADEHPRPDTSDQGQPPDQPPDVPPGLQPGQLHPRSGRGRRGWTPPAHPLDPLAQLLRARCHSRAELARITGLGYQSLRTYTDSRWTADHPPSQHVLTALARAVPAHELHTAVHAAVQQRRAPQTLEQLTLGQRTVLEALRGHDDELLIAAAPHITDLLRTYRQQHQPDRHR